MTEAFKIDAPAQSPVGKCEELNAAYLFKAW